MAADEPHARGDRALSRAARGGGIESVVCHALYLVNLASPDPVIYGKSVAAMRSSLEAADAIGAEGVIFHVGSHLGAGFEAGLEHVVPALRELLELTTDDLWLLMENSAGRRRHDRTLDRRARRDPRRARPPPTARALPRLVPLVRLRGRRHRPADPRRGGRRDRRPDRARPAPLPARQRLEGAARLEPRPARDDRRRADRRRRPAHVPRAPGVPEAPGDPRDPGPGRARAGCSSRGAPTATRSSRLEERVERTVLAMPPPRLCISMYGRPPARQKNSSSRNPAKTKCVWESTKPGMTALPPASMISGAGPSIRGISDRGPAQAIVSTLTAMAASAVTLTVPISEPRLEEEPSGVAISPIFLITSVAFMRGLPQALSAAVERIQTDGSLERNHVFRLRRSHHPVAGRMQVAACPPEFALVASGGRIQEFLKVGDAVGKPLPLRFDVGAEPRSVPV